MPTEPTKSVKLTLQETGFLHNQMTKIIVDQGTKGLPQWFFDLYDKLGAANDKLMYKK